MKKALLILPVMFLFVGCAKEPGAPLPPPEESTYTVTLTPANSTLTTADSSAALQVELSAVEDAAVKYTLEIGSPCYLTTKDGFDEIIVKPGAYIKSVSSYTVDRIVIDFFSKKGINQTVYSKADGTGDAVEYHSSTTASVDTSTGSVYEYSINGTEWSIYNKTEYNKPAFYSVTIIFSK